MAAKKNNLKTSGKNKKRRKDRNLFALNPDFELFPELRSFILKSSPAEKDKMIKRLNSLGRVKMALITGIFLNNRHDGPIRQESKADLFIVGDDIDKRKLTFFLKSLEAEVGKEIKFSMMEKEEFEYRFNMFDRFVREMLEGNHEKLINKLGI